MSGIRWAPVAAVALGVLIIGGSLTHVPLDIWTHQVHGGEQMTIDWVTASGFALPGAATGAVVAARRPVDRRFNRARYDAEIVIAAFTARLRQTVDLDAIQGDLVDTAFRPAHVSVWLPPRT